MEGLLSTGPTPSSFFYLRPPPAAVAAAKGLLGGEKIYRVFFFGLKSVLLNKFFLWKQLLLNKKVNLMKLDGVGPVDNRPSTD